MSARSVRRRRSWSCASTARASAVSVRCPDPQAGQLTLGFAVTRRAEAIALELDGRALSLPVPVLRSPESALLASPGTGAPSAQSVASAASAGTDPDALAQQLRTTRARLEEARCAAAVLEAERDGARQAAARAEAAAHDATARGAALGSDGDGAAAGWRRRSPRRTAIVMCAIGSTALVGGILAGPAGDRTGKRGVGDVASASSASSASSTSSTSSPSSTSSTDSIADSTAPRVPAVFDALAQRLRIPATYLLLYRQAGARYGLDWTRLAAIGAIESRHGQSAEAGVASGANHRGASGPAQFLAGTWERFGVDGDGDGTRDPHDPADAIAAMASYLRASGAPQDWRGALRTYNRSDAYVTAVERLAATYRRNAD
jgi:membrane-bound lytic murein transglycosylase B